MTVKFTAACLATLIATTAPLYAEGSRVCAERANVLKKLESKFGESRQSIGLGTNNRVMEIFASPETGTWTITVTSPNGTTCLIATGQAFEMMPDEKLSSVENDV